MLITLKHPFLCNLKVWVFLLLPLCTMWADNNVCLVLNKINQKIDQFQGLVYFIYLFSFDFRSRFEAMLFALCKNEENGKASMRFFLDVSCDFTEKFFWWLGIPIFFCNYHFLGNSANWHSTFQRSKAQISHWKATWIQTQTKCQFRIIEFGIWTVLSSFGRKFATFGQNFSKWFGYSWISNFLR